MSAGIRIPPELLPADGRFGAGPSKVRQAQVDALAGVWQTYLGTSHRQKAVKSEVGRLRSGLRDLFALPDGYEVVLGNGGSTAFWDIATFGLLDNRAQFLSFGEFGAKFASGAAKAPHLGEPTIITADPGTAPAFTAEAGIDAYCSPHNETSTGVIVTPRRVTGTDTDALMLIDSVIPVRIFVLLRAAAEAKVELGLAAVRQMRDASSQTHSTMRALSGRRVVVVTVVECRIRSNGFDLSSMSTDFVCCNGGRRSEHQPTAHPFRVTNEPLENAHTAQ